MPGASSSLLTSGQGEWRNRASRVLPIRAVVDYPDAFGTKECVRKDGERLRRNVCMRELAIGMRRCPDVATRPIKHSIGRRRRARLRLEMVNLD